MLKLCLMLSKTYYAKNYAGIIGLCLTPRKPVRVDGESQDVGGGHPEPHRDRTGEPKKEQTTLLD